VNPKELVLRKSLPVFINSLNQCYYLKDLIDNLLENHFSNIWILDNKSTLPSLLSFYGRLSDSRPGSVRVLFYPGNFGPRYFHLSGMFRTLWPYPHLYTDPDLLFTSIDDYFLTTLLDVSMRYGVAKVGAALTLPAESNMTPIKRIFPETNGVAVSVLEWERRFWANEVEEQIYAVSIDTTFHLFNPQFFKEDDFLVGIRIAREGYQARHRPWFLDDFAPAAELEF
jgi:hypothetical protein